MNPDIARIMMAAGKNLHLWNLDYAIYSSKSKSVASQDSATTGVFFKPDGTRMYVTGRTNDRVYEYLLSTAWDVTTATYNTYLGVGSQEANPQDVFISPDGTKLYITGSTADTIFQYTLSTPWSLATASYASKSLSVAAQSTIPMGLFLSSDGTKAYIASYEPTYVVFQYTLSTAWDISTGSYASKSFSLSTQITQPLSLAFKSNGKIMYAVGDTPDTVFQYSLSTPWDVSTASYSGKSLSVTNQTTTAGGVYIKPNGTGLYILGSGSVFQYAIG